MSHTYNKGFSYFILGYITVSGVAIMQALEILSAFRMCTDTSVEDKDMTLTSKIEDL